MARRAALHRWTRARFGATSFGALGVPGGEIIDRGLDDLVAGRESVESLAVSLAAPRLRREGVPLPPLPTQVARNADVGLYRLLERTHGDDLAHPRYLAYFRQLASFADALSATRAA